MSAREEISNFLASGEAGVKANNAKNALIRAAESIFTAKGLACPILVLEKRGATYLINRRSL